MSLPILIYVQDFKLSIVLV